MNTIRNALAHASEDYGIQVDYLNPKDGSIEEMARILRGTSPTQYSAVISTIADFNLLQLPLADIVRFKRLPLITVNSQSPVAPDHRIRFVGTRRFVAVISHRSPAP